MGGSVVRDPGDGAPVAIVRLHDYRLAAFRPGDRASSELLSRLHRSPKLKTRLGLAVLGGPSPLGKAIAGLRPATQACQVLVAELVGELRGFLNGDVVSFAMSLNEEVNWTMSAVRRANDTVFVTARTRGRRVVTDQAAFLREFESVRPASIVAPRLVGAGTGGRWSMLALSDAGGVAQSGNASLEELLPYLISLRDTGGRAATYSAAIDGLAAAFGEDVSDAHRLLGEALTRWGEREMLLCRAHGDFVPWNFGVAEGRLHLWDWSRAMPEAPWPYDAIHHCFQSRRHVRGEGREEALRGTLTDIARLAERLGVPATDDDARRMMLEYAAFRSANEHRVETVGSDTEWLEERAVHLA